ncbi:MAG: UpxY family transcription antiterminator [Cyclobacteriaceae bacterium]
MERGYEVFLPLQKVVRQWSDRKKKIETPLFNSYIFVLETEDKIQEILQAPGISWNLRYNDRPAVLRDEELKTIKRFLESGLLLETGPFQIMNQGDSVEVIDGQLKGLKGNILRSSSGNKLIVALEAIQQNIMIDIDPTVLKLLK